MRPARQWLAELHGTVPDSPEPVALVSERIIQEIQADAMRGAAQVAKDYCAAHYGTIGRGQGVRIFAENLAKQLEDEARRLESNLL